MVSSYVFKNKEKFGFPKETAAYLVSNQSNIKESGVDFEITCNNRKFYIKCVKRVKPSTFKEITSEL